MSELLRQLYDGQLYPSEEIIPQGKDYRATTVANGKEREYFKTVLSPEDAERFTEWDKKMFEASSEYAYTNFEYGFKLGARLLCELLFGDGGPDA